MEKIITNAEWIGCLTLVPPPNVSGVYPDKVGFEAAEMLLRNIRHNGCVDEFLQDQVSNVPRTHTGVFHKASLGVLL